MSKQSKQYESMRQTQVNTFSDGLNMDLHPLTTPNTILTDCVNGTMITYNDNEFVLQNARGNSIIPNANLNPGFIPVAMKEHNGIIYIISHNPSTKQSEIGTFPSPMKNDLHKSTSIGVGRSSNNTFEYSTYNSEVQYYNYNLVISSYDKYKITNINNNPLLLLEHYILTENGKTSKVDLNYDGKPHRFKIISDGILGYKYRPYYVDSLNIEFVPSELGDASRLNVNFSSSDTQLIENITNSNNENLSIEGKIQMYIENDEPTDIGLGTYYFTFNTKKIHEKVLLKGTYSQEIKFNEQNNKYEYDKEHGVIKHVFYGDEYKNIRFIVDLYISDKNEDGEKFTMHMDTLTQSYITDVWSAFGQDSVFDEFNYIKNDDNTLIIKASLNTKLLDSSITQNDIYDAYCTLYEIDNDGNVKGSVINTKQHAEASIKSYTVFNAETQKATNYDLFLNAEGYPCFKTSDNTEFRLSKPYNDKEQCENVDLSKPSSVKYVKVGDTYELQLWKGNVKIATEKYTKPSDTEPHCIDNAWYDDRWTSVITFENNHVNYTFENIPFEKNKVYLMELECEIKSTNYKFGFFVITTDKMLNNPNTNKHKLTIADWFDTNITSTVTWGEGKTESNKTQFSSNNLPLDKIAKVSVMSDLVYKFAIQFNTLMENPGLKDIPSITYSMPYRITFKDNKSNFPIYVHGSIGNNEINLVTNIKNKPNVYDGNMSKTLSLVVDKSTNIDQTAQRVYLYDKLNEIPHASIILGDAYVQGERAFDMSINEYQDAISFSVESWKSHYDIYRTYFETSKRDWLNTNRSTELKKEVLHKLRGGCSRSASGYEINFVDFSSVKTNKTPAVDLIFGNESTRWGMCYGKITNSDHVEYSGNDKKMWIRGLNDDGTYVLVGMDVPNDDFNDAKNRWEILKRHSYYKEKVDKTITQYTYKDNLKITSSFSDTEKFNLKAYPTLCDKLYETKFELNMQGMNNVNITLLETEEHIVNLQSYAEDTNYKQWKTFETKYSEFLRYLGQKLTENPINSDDLQWNSNDEEGVIYQDFKDKLFTENGQSRMFEDLQLNKKLYYDVTDGVLFIDVKGLSVEKFEYTSKSDCVTPFEWNYKCDYITTNTDITEVKDYHSMLFYNYSNYLKNVKE